MERAQSWTRIKELFDAALELGTDQREAFLRQACGDDQELLAEVNSLLAADRDSESLSHNPWQHRMMAESRVPAAFGPYTLVKKLGEGGMGEVWLAEQTAPVKRQVAIKFVRPGIFSGSLLQRFQWERQSLAMMDHPVIAKVFEAGSTPSGEPYLVMEYVPGQPITDYCDARKLTIPERLQLFIRACEGVQHAHQKAIVHRDLKPANILVVEVDGQPMPRIIDFGLAKAALPLIDDQTVLQTQAGTFLGTPGYMSPEQVDPEVGDVDTRTDVYSLGVVLYVLLTGLVPFDVKGKPVHEMVLQLREQDAPRPSTRVETEEDSASNAAARGTGPSQLRTTLSGDLDWIAMKALEKDPDRRYGTPYEMAADIRRFLNHEPIMARPASVSYKLKKYVRRHRMGVGFAVAMALVLASFTVMQARQLRRTTRERDRADRVTEYMAGMFKVSSPSEARGNTITAREVLDKASKDIGSGLARDPELQAQMMVLMSRVYGTLGLYGRAEALARQAIDIRSRVLGPDHPQTLEAMDRLEWALNRQGKSTEAEKLERETLETRLRVLGKENPGTATSMVYLAWSLQIKGQYTEAEVLQREALAIRRRVLGPEHPDTLVSMTDLSATMILLDRLAEAEKLEREALDIQRRILGHDHPDTLQSLDNLALTLKNEGRYTEAEELEREAIDALQRVLGSDHPQTLGATHDLGIILLREGRYTEAEELERKGIDALQRVQGSDHPQTLGATHDLGIVLLREGRYSEAEKLMRDVIERQLRVLGLEHPDTAVAVYNLACVEAIAGRPDAALKDLKQAVEHGLPANALLGMAIDPDLKSLRGDSRFKQLVVLAKARASKP